MRCSMTAAAAGGALGRSAPDAQVWVVGADGVGRMDLDRPPRGLAMPASSPVHRRRFRGSGAAQRDRMPASTGSQIHGANGYLIDQFLRDGARTSAPTTTAAASRTACASRVRSRPLAGFDGATLFGGSEQGYTDYPR
jgi:hypothetical protein